jgi:hypothetical protein
MGLSPVSKRWAILFPCQRATRRYRDGKCSQEASMLTESARGVYVISVTPFDESGALDLEGTDRLIDFYVKSGADGITILGVMGEGRSLPRRRRSPSRAASLHAPASCRWW